MQLKNFLSLKMNAYEYFHISNKDLRNNLVLKDKNV